MQYLALAVDFDATLARDGAVAPEVLAALQKLAASGRKLLLVTGRKLDQLLDIFPAVTVFDRVVAENGALLYRPSTRERIELSGQPSQPFVQELRRRGVQPLEVGESIVATVQPNETVVLEVIRDLGLELQVIFNKGAVMVLPPGINKASGLVTALGELGLSPHNVIAIGDGENDHAMLDTAEVSVAVRNAVPMLQEKADRVTSEANGRGVLQIVSELLEGRSPVSSGRPPRRTILLGNRMNGESLVMPANGFSLLLAGSSGSGKTTLASGILERLQAQEYQFCIVDPEGDYDDFGDAIVLGSADRAPGAEEVLTALDNPGVNIVINLIGLPLQDRPAFFSRLLPGLQQLRIKTGRPHWILVDETHHLMPADADVASEIVTQPMGGMIYVTVHPESVSPAVLRTVGAMVALGESPLASIDKFCRAAGIRPPTTAADIIEPGQALFWVRGQEEATIFKIAPGHLERRRHIRKYAEGELPPERSFFFRGPEGRLNLRAQNLVLFNQLAEGVDDDTWLHHLRQGDYSTWLRKCIKDDALAEETRAVERQAQLSAAQSRRMIREAIEQRYTLPPEREAAH